MKTPAFFDRSDLGRALWGFRGDFLQVGSLSFLSNLLMLAPTIYMLQIFDRVLASQSELTLLAISLITLLLFGALALSEWLRSRLLVRASLRFDRQLGTRVFNGSFQACLGQSAPSASRPFADLNQIRQFLTGPGVFALFDAPWTPIYIAVIFFLHPWLGVLALGFALVQAALAWFGQRKTVAPSEAALKAASETMGDLQGKLRNVEVLESMGMVANLQKRWNRQHAACMDKSASANGLVNRVAGWSKFVRYSQQSLALGAGALLVIDGQLSPGAMIAANVLMGRALAPIDQLLGTWRGFVSCRAAFGRLEKLLAEFPGQPPFPPRAGPTGEISLQGVFAGAAGRPAPILKNISFAVPAGTVVALLGPSGSGKSTLVKVMVGIWTASRGAVLLDGVPVRSWNRLELGPHLGYLPQDVELFGGSIAENIARLGEIDSRKVIEAACSAGLHETILRFPKGYDTLIGDAGHLLSGGQRQRIGLARALYGDPSLIVLDEPNANLDDAGEAALLRAIRELKSRGKTVFLVTHRQGAVAVADRLMVLSDGELTADGLRDAVLASLRRPQPDVRPAVLAQSA
ncbi:type I secretion system permease/ATPase [Variovorax sp. NFACC27]|uniref:type I secretion system permease/ATPase n=1 Tax=unclassified Variovorax TaxID=663243 RepID=UPI000894255A|nr:ATP-binding cassette, subfamily C, exporter for protease/lipase [Variovorax sp. NFACC28]SEG58883.1 ATP-binding cassette, subfamily C, exporter for protease/lipase [Variovorax sp. NFACC29]SFC57936.1 ATP-binding cassette, subfamily C, exporter for protease/lipase [Variovorax sp. NFACC26]SFG66148.1 ATP-binding cassette, subfamily C, exporter for protease/lipase [Variovorax sp. NFACC27]